jgi:predicted MFS family arabinose efflux permease
LATDPAAFHRRGRLAPDPYRLFPAREAGLRVSLAISTTLAGMALGGWLAGAIYDRTGSYATALVNGIAWNIANMTIVGWLLQRKRRRPAGALVTA